MSWGAVNGPAPQTPVAAAGVNPAFAQFRGSRKERYLVSFGRVPLPFLFNRKCLTGRTDASLRSPR